MTRIAAARVGGINAPSRPMEMVGRPEPMTPFTAPAMAKTAATTASSARSSVHGGSSVKAAAVRQRGCAAGPPCARPDRDSDQKIERAGRTRGDGVRRPRRRGRRDRASADNVRPGCRQVTAGLSNAEAPDAVVRRRHRILPRRMRILARLRRGDLAPRLAGVTVDDRIVILVPIRLPRLQPDSRPTGERMLNRRRSRGSQDGESRSSGRGIRPPTEGSPAGAQKLVLSLGAPPNWNQDRRSARRWPVMRSILAKRSSFAIGLANR